MEKIPPAHKPPANGAAQLTFVNQDSFMNATGKAKQTVPGLADEPNLFLAPLSFIASVAWA